MKVLVTGATGFIGRHLVSRLIRDDRDVRCLVRKSSNTSFLKDFINIEFIHGDLLDVESLYKAVEGVDIIYHLGGAVSNKGSKSYHEVNVLGTRNLLKVCKNTTLRKVIILSSITAVGPQEKREILLNENTNCKPMPPYGKSKYGAERIAFRFYRKHKIPVVVVRPPLVYGPGQPFYMTDMFRKIDKGIFRFVGNGQAMTSLCYIDNLIDGLLLIEESEKSVGKVYFISDENYYTFYQIAHTIAQGLNKGLSRFRLPKFISKISGSLFNFLNALGFTSITLYSLKLMTVDYACDISKAKEELSFVPKVSFEDGIKNTIFWYKNNFKK